MAKFTDHISSDLQEVIEAQHMFFVATAAAEGRINASPKGMDTLRVLGPTTVAYLDYTGSGNETAAHLLADGRITVMLCRFDRTPDIIRLYGRGEVVPRGSERWDELIGTWDVVQGARQLMVVDVESVQSSCGYAVPHMEFVSERTTLTRYWDGQGGDEGAVAYRADRNMTSIDGLATPAMDVGSRS